MGSGDYQAAIAKAIVESEAFMWLMVGANHPDAHLDALRPAHAVLHRLRAGWEWPKPERADGCRYWTRYVEPHGWEPLTAEERQVVEAVESA